MFAWKLSSLFVCALLQTISGESADDGRALFFGIPIPLLSYETSSPVHALLKSTFLNADTKDELVEDPLATILPGEDEMKEPESGVAPTQEAGNEFPGQDPIFFIPNFLQTEETTANSRQQPARVVTLASLIRSAVALTRPLTAPRPMMIQNLFSKSTRDPLRDMISLAEGLVGRMGNTIARQGPIDFLNLIDSMQKAVGLMDGDGECDAISDLLDHTVESMKEMLEMMNAVQKLGEMWSTVNISTLGKCVTNPRTVSAKAEQEVSEKAEED